MMKNGKIQPAVLDRSVMRILRLSGSGSGEIQHGADAAVQSSARDRRGSADAFAQGPVGGRFDLTPEMILSGSINNLAAAGAVCRQIQTGILLPEEAEEPQLKELMQRIAAFAAENGIQIIGGDTAVSDAVIRPVLSVAAQGEPVQDEPENAAETGRREEPSAGAEKIGEAAVIMTGYAGCAGTAVLARAHEPQLRSRFPASLVEAALHMEKDVLCSGAADCLAEKGTVLMHDVSRGGVFAALWELSRRLETVCRLGLEIDLKAIPIRQETIEICEIYDLNPYQLFGQGSMLLITEYPAALLDRLSAKGISGTVIGRTSSGKGCRIHSGEELRYLEKPQQDALWLHAKNVAISEE